MLRALIDEIESRKAHASARAASNAALARSVAGREAQLGAEVEAMRASEAAELRGFLPLLISKQRRLDELEKEVVENEIVTGDLEEEEDDEEVAPPPGAHQAQHHQAQRVGGRHESDTMVKREPV